jgi:hypothetical protein
MPGCKDFKKAILVSMQLTQLFYQVTLPVLQSAKVAVSGGKKIKACGRTYFFADSAVI